MISIITMIVTFVCGYLSKKSTFISNNLIPIQNILIGLVVALVEFFVTKNFSVAISISGIIAGGTYDIFHNLKKLIDSSTEKNIKEK